MPRRRWSLLLSCSALAAILLLPPGVAGGGLRPASCVLENVKSRLVVDIPRGSTADGVPVVQWSLHGAPNQQFTIEGVDSTFNRIRNVNSGKVLDVAGGSTADGAPVLQWSWHGGANQQWYVAEASGNIVVFLNRASGKVLDVSGGSMSNGAPLIQWTWHGGLNQIFRQVNCLL